MKTGQDPVNATDVASSNRTLSLLGGKKRGWEMIGSGFGTPVKPSPRVQVPSSTAHTALLSPLSSNGIVPTEANGRETHGNQPDISPALVQAIPLPPPSPIHSSPAVTQTPEVNTEDARIVDVEAPVVEDTSIPLQATRAMSDNRRDAELPTESSPIAQHGNTNTNADRTDPHVRNHAEPTRSIQTTSTTNSSTPSNEIIDVLSNSVALPTTSPVDKLRTIKPAPIFRQYSHPSTQPAKRQKKSSATVLVTAMAGWVDIIDNYIARNGGLPSLNTVERARFGLLRDACSEQDCFYVALHQLYCVHATDRSILQRIPGYHHERMSTAFQILDQLIRSNKELRQGPLKFFVSFPNDVLIMAKVSEQYAQIINDVFNFLSRFAIQWGNFTDLCRGRGYPPTVGELIQVFHLKSSVLQGIIFTATRRNIGIVDDTYGERMQQMFVEDRERHKEWSARMHTDRPPGVQEVDMFNNNLTIRYQKIVNDVRCAKAISEASGSPRIRANSASWTSSGNMSPNVPMQANISALHNQSNPSITQYHTIPQGQYPQLPSNLQNDQARQFTPLAPRPRQNSAQFNTYQQQFNPSLNSSHMNQPMVPPQQMLRQSLHTTPTTNSAQQYHNMPHQQLQQQPQYYHIPNGQQQLPQFVQVQHTGSHMPMHTPSLQHTHASSNSPVIPQNMPSMQSVSHARPLESHRRVQSAHLGHSPNAISPGTQFTSPNGSQFPSQALPTPPPQTPQALPMTNGIDQKSSLSTAQYGAAHPLQRSIIPPLGWQSPAVAYNPDMNAIHQTYLRSPLMVVSEGTPPQVEKIRYYQMVNGFAIKPQIIPSNKRLSTFDFMVSKDSLARLVEYQAVVSGTTISKQRRISPGSLQFRARCITSTSQTPLSLSEWTVMESTWPKIGFFLEINDNVVDIRRKAQHSRDIPVDITPFVAASKHMNGMNQVQLSLLQPDDKIKQEKLQFAIEIVSILSHQDIITMVTTKQRRSKEEMLKWIKSRLSSDDDDDDIQMVTADLTIGIRCPFTATLWKTPVKGAACLHAECFDLETFLLSRPSRPKYPSEPCMVDVWKCPHCLQDVRPDMLIVDEWMVEIKDALLARKVAPESAFLLVDKDGKWRIKPEVMTGTGMKKDRIVPARSSAEIKLNTPCTTDSTSLVRKKVIEVIDLDDD